MKLLTLLPFYAALPLTLLAINDGGMKSKDTEVWKPVPKVVASATNTAPSDAIVLFDGQNLDAWQNENGNPAKWKVKDNILTVNSGAGSIVTKESFSDCQLHLEWRSPTPVVGEGQMRGNSGVFFMEDRYEVQILDSYNNSTYANGQAASIYKQYTPLVNACRAAGEWQSYDIIFKAPRFNTDGSLKSPAFVTLIHNGILVQDHVELKGMTKWIGQPNYEKHAFELPISLQDHGCPVSYRNIWVRRYNSNELFNGQDLDGWYSFLEKEKYEDSNKNFQVENGLLHILGKEFGYLATNESFNNYHLRVEFKWGEKKWPPRETAKRDSGVLYHFAQGLPDTIWPKSTECQIQEGDCGDIWCVGTMLESPNKDEKAWGMKHVFRTEDFENEHGEWNVIEVIANDNTIEHWVNGHLVNVGTSSDVSNGRILIQSEGAEIWYRSIRITPL